MKVLFTDILPIIISIIAFLYAIWIDSKRRKLERKLLEPQLSIIDINYKLSKTEESYLAYYVGIDNNVTPNDCKKKIIISIKNNSTGIAKNISIEKSSKYNFSFKKIYKLNQDIGSNAELDILFKIPPSLDQDYEVLYFILTCENINGKLIKFPIEFKLRGPVNRNNY